VSPSLEELTRNPVRPISSSPPPPPFLEARRVSRTCGPLNALPLRAAEVERGSPGDTIFCFSFPRFPRRGTLRNLGAYLRHRISPPPWLLFLLFPPKVFLFRKPGKNPQELVPLSTLRTCPDYRVILTRLSTCGGPPPPPFLFSYFEAASRFLDRTSSISRIYEDLGLAGALV